jgi:hypothetical protein
MNRFTLPSSQISRDTDPPIDGGSGLPIPPAGHIEHAQRDDDSFSDGMDSAMRKHSAAHATIEKLPRYMFSRVCVFLIMLMWVIPGFLKVKDLSAFMGVVEQHEVIPEQYEPLLLWVGPGELVMGLLLVFVMGSEFRKPFGKLVLVLSAGLIGMFTYYLSLVDPVVLQESGCGCMSDYRIASGIEDGPRYFAYGKNAVLVGLHFVALFLPAMVDSGLRKTA